MSEAVLRWGKVFDIAAAAVAGSALAGTGVDRAAVAARARSLLVPVKRDAAAAAIHASVEAGLKTGSVADVKRLLERLRPFGGYVASQDEFEDVYWSAYRLTHTEELFNICQGTLRAALATLITTIVVNQSIMAADALAGFDACVAAGGGRAPWQQMRQLLDIKYAVINLLQYKFLPVVFADYASAAGYKCDVPIRALPDLPVDCEFTRHVYQQLGLDGVPLTRNYSEFVAGVDIRQLRRFTDKLADYGKGHVADGRVSSPTATALVADRAPVAGPASAESVPMLDITEKDIRSFVILDYLYALRMLAHAVYQKAKHSCKKNGVQLIVNAPLKTLTVPASSGGAGKQC
ncbi:ORF100 [Saltwater crocodilepox virus]|nr:ORF102 [Saltwater crocodilepox virus]QGT47617.1 ORF100 [Saltwater crocodilepox virus]